MIERRFIGRRFIDFHPDAAHPLYPNELERRIAKRRGDDRDGTPNFPDALLPGRRRRPPILWSGIVRCQNCGREWSRTRNLSSENRRYFIIEHAFSLAPPRCKCDNAHAQIDWVSQAGTES